MVYDLTGPWAPTNDGPHSPYSFALNSIDYWMDQGLEKERMTLGVPFYGYNFTNQNNVVSVTFREMVEANPENAQFDQVGDIYYNGLPTITQKTELALKELSGMMIWELGQDHFGEYSLLDRIFETKESFLTTSTAGVFALPSKLYPNPTIDLATLEFESPIDAEVLLLSQSLSVLERKAIQQRSKIPIQLSNYPKGLYFVTIKSDNFIKTLKLVKT